MISHATLLPLRMTGPCIYDGREHGEGVLKVENLMWLLPAVFMLHDFEEIIMMRPWVNRNADFLRERFPRLSNRILGHYKKLSTSSFALAVSEEFVIIAAVTFLAVEHGWYAAWGGVLLGFFAHIIVHLVQFLVVRRYAPMIITSIPAALYCVYAVNYLLTAGYTTWQALWPWTLFFIAFVAVNILLVHRMAARFEQWLRRYGKQEVGVFNQENIIE